MGLILNGMIVASERDIQAIGRNRPDYYNALTYDPASSGGGANVPQAASVLPQNGGEQAASCTADSGSCPKGKKAPATEATGGVKIAEEAVSKLGNIVGDVKNIENEVKHEADTLEGQVNAYLNKHKELKDALNALDEAVTAGEKVKKTSDDVKKAFPDAGVGTQVVLVLVALALDALLGEVGEKLSEWINDHLKELEDDLLKYVQDYINEKYVAANDPYPATIDCFIGHAPDALDTILAMLATSGSGAVPNYATKEDQGKICAGSPDVFFGGKAVARVKDIVDCDLHCPSKVAQGSKSVFANRYPIARVGNKTTCNGVIKTGVKSIAINMEISSTAEYIDAGYAPALLDLAGLLSGDVPPDEVNKEASDYISDKITGKIQDGIKNAAKDKAAKDAGSGDDGDSEPGS